VSRCIKSKLRSLTDDVRIEEDEYDYEGPNDCSSQRTKFEFVSIKAKGPMDKFTQQTPEELMAGFAKTKQTTIDYKQKKDERRHH